MGCTARGGGSGFVVFRLHHPRGQGGGARGSRTGRAVEAAAAAAASPSPSRSSRRRLAFLAFFAFFSAFVAAADSDSAEVDSAEVVEVEAEAEDPAEDPAEDARFRPRPPRSWRSTINPHPQSGPRDSGGGGRRGAVAGESSLDTEAC